MGAFWSQLVDDTRQSLWSIGRHHHYEGNLAAIRRLYERLLHTEGEYGGQPRNLANRGDALEDVPAAGGAERKEGT